jgi:hypothetical protein
MIRLPGQARGVRGLRAFILLALLASAWEEPAWADEGFANVGSMSTGRFFHAAVPLGDGTVLVISEGFAEKFDPAAKTFAFAGLLNDFRGFGLTATLLLDGRVLIVGGQSGDTSHGSAEIYDPTTGSFTPTGSMATPRAFHTATLLVDGRVLVAGGHSGNFHSSALASTELYDPQTGLFSAVGNMGGAREEHTANLLPDGKVLVAGGYDSSFGALSSAETYDTVAQAFSPTGPMGEGRGNHTATSLPNGTILVAGGHVGFPGASLASVELYDPAAGVFSLTQNMGQPRGAHAAATLANGSVLITGGYTAFPFTGQTLSSAEIYDPLAGAFTGTAGMHAERGRHTATPLPNGDILVAGGLSGFGILDSAEVFSLTLVDTQPPQISVPSDMTVFASDPSGAVVSYFVSVTDDIDPNPQLDCVPASGSTFPIGTTTVVCSATDAAGNTATAGFQVTVIESLSLTVALGGFGSVDVHSGVATVGGSVSCNRALRVSVFGELIQPIANHAELRGTYFTEVDCQGSGKWTASVSPQNGRFKGGKAKLSGTAFSCDQFGSCDFESAQREIQLRGR